MDAFTFLNTTARLSHYEELARTMPVRKIGRTLRDRLRALVGKHAKVANISLMPVQRIDG